MIIDVVSMAMVLAKVAYLICFSSLRVVANILHVSRLQLTPINGYCKKYINAMISVPSVSIALKANSFLEISSFCKIKDHIT